MSSLDVIVAAVLGGVSGQVTNAALVPVEAWRQDRIERIRKRLSRAQEAAENAAPDRPLDPSDRVAYRALTEAAVTDDGLVADYLGGVVAASHSHDDSGVPIVALISRLSAVQLRAHYVLYRSAQMLLAGDMSINLYENRKRPWIEIPRGAWARAMENTNIGLTLSSVLNSLYGEGLIGGFRYGPVPEDESGEFYSRVPLTPLGAELFLWGHGDPNAVNANSIFRSPRRVELIEKIPSVPEARICERPT